MTEKEPDRPEQDEETPPKNPLYGKFDEMVDAALSHRLPKRRIMFRKQAKPKENEEQD